MSVFGVKHSDREGGVVSGYSRKFYLEKLIPEVQTLTLSYNFNREGTSFVYLYIIENSTPFRCYRNGTVL